MSNDTYGYPADTHIETSEDLTLGFDFTSYLTGVQTLATATSTMVNKTTGATVTLTDGPAVLPGALTVAQRVRGSELTAGSRYRLTVTGTVTASTNVFSVSIDVICDF